MTSYIIPKTWVFTKSFSVIIESRTLWKEGQISPLTSTGVVWYTVTDQRAGLGVYSNEL